MRQIMLCAAAAHDSPSVDEVQGRQCHGRAVNFGHGRLGSGNALDLFKVGAKQLANFNVVKQDGIFGTHVKPGKKLKGSREHLCLQTLLGQTSPMLWVKVLNSCLCP